MISLLTTAKNLVLEGHTVLFCSDASFREEVKKTGAAYSRYDFELHRDIEIDNNIDNAFFAFSVRILQATNEYMPRLLSEAQLFKPDCILYDSFAYWGKVLYKKLCIPGICSVTNYPFNKECYEQDSSIFLRYILNWKKNIDEQSIDHHRMLLRGFSRHISRKYLDKLIFDIFELTSGSGDYNIVYSCSELHSNANLFDDSYHFVGPYLQDRIIKNKYVEAVYTDIYIALGSMIKERYDLYNQFIDLFSCTKWKVILNIGTSDERRLNKASENIKIVKYADQLHLLSNCGVFITHGGFNSINEAIYFGVPVLVIPMYTDAFFSANEIHKRKIGVRIDLDDIPSALDLSLYCIEKEKIYKEQVNNYSAIWKNTDSKRKIFDIIYSVI